MIQILGVSGSLNWRIHSQGGFFTPMAGDLLKVVEGQGQLDCYPECLQDGVTGIIARVSDSYFL
jgi:hypothetical protein